MKKIINYFLPVAVLIAMILGAFLESAIGDSPPYLRTLNTVRIVNVSSASELVAALNAAASGDQILLADGTYTGQFIISKDATDQNPIVIKASGHAVINGNIKMDADENYVIGLEVTGGNGTSGIDLFCKNCGAINNVVHDVNGAVGIGAWNSGPGQIIYGNIVYAQIPNANNPHNIYTQNNYAANGYKYFVANVVLDPAATGNTFNFHAYGQQTYISGFWLERNVFMNGSTLIGSWSAIEPDHDQIMKDNYFWNAELRMGYKRPISFSATGNYLGQSYIRTQLQWGTPEQVFPEMVGATIFKGNTIAYPLDQHIQFEAYSYADPCGTKDPACPRKDGVNIRPDNDFDSNVFIPNFKAAFFAGGVNNGNVTSLATWQSLSESAGKKFDQSSVINSSEMTKQFFIQNEYDPALGFLIIYNWENKPSITFNHAGSFALYNVKDAFGAPVLTGTDSATVPTPSQFQIFLVRSAPPPPNECNPAAVFQLSTEIFNISIDPTLSKDKRIRQMRKKDVELINLCDQ